MAPIRFELTLGIDMRTEEFVKAMRRTYDLYYLGGAYRRRYPRPNASTLDFVLTHAVPDAHRILDFGCGEGRYCFALLERTNAHVTAYDISASSLLALHAQLMASAYRERVTLAGAEMSQLDRDAPYDAILMLFGVLSLIGDRAARVEVLSALRRLICEDGRLVVSVPSIWRRRPCDLLRHALARRLRRAEPPLHEGGNIQFVRSVRGRALTFFYHLYGVRDLRRDLEEAGFAVRRCEAESLLPEWCVTQSRLIERIDRTLCRWLPAALGYGIRVLAVPA
jgi:SAM-dependent methyltransferase